MHLLYFEEAQSAIFSKLLEQRGRTPTVATLATQARSYGMGLVVLCQNPITKIITEMLSNSANLICFHVGGTEIKGMMDCMGLSPEQADTLGHLQPGEAIFKTSLGYTEPVHIKISQIDTKPLSDEEVENLMRPIWDELLSKVTPVDKQEANILSNSKKQIREEPTEQRTMNDTFSDINEKKSSELKLDDEFFLKDIQSRPYEYTEDRYSKGRLTRNRAIKAKERLCRLDYLHEVRFRIGSRGKPPSILRFTEKAVAHLNISQSKGKGSLEHQWWQYLILHFAKQIDELKAKIEDMGADVSISKGNIDVAIEITLNDTNVLQNIQRDSHKGYNEVWIAVNDKVMQKKIIEQLDSYASWPVTIKVFLLNEIILEIKKFCTDK